MSGVAGKPRQTRLYVLLLAVKSHKKRLGCGHIVDTLTTISTFQRDKRNRVLQVLSLNDGRARGATVIYGDKQFSFAIQANWMVFTFNW